MSRDNKGIKTRKNGNFGEEKYTESITRHLALKRAARRRRAGTRCRAYRVTDRPSRKKARRVRAKPLANAAAFSFFVGGEKCFRSPVACLCLVNRLSRHKPHGYLFHVPIDKPHFALSFRAAESNSKG